MPSCILSGLFHVNERQDHSFLIEKSPDRDTVSRVEPSRELARAMNHTSSNHDRTQIFRVRQLTKVYGEGLAEVRALAGVDLDLYAGELVVLLGPSGSGKTTLLNNLGGLDLPTAGELRYRDLDLAAADENRPDGLPPRTRRVRLSVLQPDPQPDRPGERRADHRNRPRSHAARACPRNGPPRRPPRSFPRPTLRRRTAARGDRPRHCQTPRGAAVRRADRGPGRAHRRRGARSHRTRQPRTRHPHASSSPTTRSWPKWRTGSSTSPMAACNTCGTTPAARPPAA